jgi:hypothetical protein
MWHFYSATFPELCGSFRTAIRMTMMRRASKRATNDCGPLSGDGQNLIFLETWVWCRQVLAIYTPRDEHDVDCYGFPTTFSLTERRRNSDEWNVPWVGVKHSSKIQEKLGAVFGALTSPHNQGKLWKTNRFQKRAGEEQSNSSSGQKVSR